MGRRVRVVRDLHPLPAGLTGTVVGVSGTHSGLVVIRWDVPLTTPWEHWFGKTKYEAFLAEINQGSDRAAQSGDDAGERARATHRAFPESSSRARSAFSLVGKNHNSGNVEAPKLERRSKMVKDLVCGMQVDEKEAAGTSNYKGKAYYFCSLSCKEQFDRRPEKFARVAGVRVVQEYGTQGEQGRRGGKQRGGGHTGEAPRSPQEIQQRIAAKAYELYETRGSSVGRDLEDWLEAERLVLIELKSAGPFEAYLAEIEKGRIL